MIDAKEHLLREIPSALEAQKVKGAKDKLCHALIDAISRHLLEIIPDCQNIIETGFLHAKAWKKTKLKDRFEWELNRIIFRFCAAYIGTVEVAVARDGEGWLYCNEGLFDPKFLESSSDTVVDYFSRRRRKPGGGTRKIENMPFTLRKKAK